MAPVYALQKVPAGTAIATALRHTAQRPGEPDELPPDQPDETPPMDPRPPGEIPLPDQPDELPQPLPGEVPPGQPSELPQPGGGAPSAVAVKRTQVSAI